MINSFYNVKYSVRNSLDKLERFRSYLTLLVNNKTTVAFFNCQIHHLKLLLKAFSFYPEGCCLEFQFQLATYSRYIVCCAAFAVTESVVFYSIGFNHDYIRRLYCIIFAMNRGKRQPARQYSRNTNILMWIYISLIFLAQKRTNSHCHQSLTKIRADILLAHASSLVTKITLLARPEYYRCDFSHGYEHHLEVVHAPYACSHNDLPGGDFLLM